MAIRGRLATILTLVLAALALPGGALARPSDESCAAYRAIPFSTPVPDAFRTPGTHRFEYLSTYDNADGTSGEDLAQNQMAIVGNAPLYPNTVLLRLFRNTTLLPSGEIVALTEMNPAQSATFYIAAFSTHGDDVFLDSFRTWFRYETSRNRWTEWTELQRGPETNFCNQVTKSAWKKTYGWD